MEKLANKSVIFSQTNANMKYKNIPANEDAFILVFIDKRH